MPYNFHSIQTIAPPLAGVCFVIDPEDSVPGCGQCRHPDCEPPGTFISV